MALEAVRALSDNQNFALFNYDNALQSDMVEYNQCQAMLKSLYELGIPGRNDEFTAYRILLLLHGMNRSGAFSYNSTISLYVAWLSLHSRTNSISHLQS